MLQIAKYSESGPIIKITTASIEYIRNIYRKVSLQQAPSLALPQLLEPTEFYIYLALKEQFTLKSKIHQKYVFFLWPVVLFVHLMLFWCELPARFWRYQL